MLISILSCVHGGDFIASGMYLSVGNALKNLVYWCYVGVEVSARHVLVIWVIIIFCAHGVFPVTRQRNFRLICGKNQKIYVSIISGNKF